MAEGAAVAARIALVFGALMWGVGALLHAELFLIIVVLLKVVVAGSENLRGGWIGWGSRWASGAVRS